MRCYLRHSAGGLFEGRGWGGSGEARMPQYEMTTELFGLPVWAIGAGALAAVASISVAIAIARYGLARGATVLFRFAVVVLGAVILWTFFDRGEVRERLAGRRALDQRAAELTARAIAPGSALACLDAIAGDAVESACEKAVFASPEATAAAVAYVSARLALLAEATQFAARMDASYEGTLATLRQAIETDRFGIVAHVLSVRDSCTPLQCDSLALLRDPARVQANLRE